MDSDKHILLISGTGRSGTNITKEMLKKHRQVYALPFEYRFIVDPNGIIDIYNTLKNSWSPYIVDAKVKNSKKYLLKLGKRNFLNYLLGKFVKLINRQGRFLTPPPYFEWELKKCFPNYVQHIESLFDKLIDFPYNAVWPGTDKFQFIYKMDFIAYNKNIDQILQDFFRSLFDDLLNNYNKTHFVEDNTWSILFGTEILKLIPNAKILHIYRDPRDVVVSLMSQRWAPSGINECIKYYSSLMTKIFEVKNKIEEQKLLEIALENLVKFPKSTIEKICNFISLEFDEDLLKINLSKSNSGKWFSALNTDQQQQINKSLKYYLDYYGYK